jgi:hypothetical protein
MLRAILHSMLHVVMLVEKGVRREIYTCLKAARPEFFQNLERERTKEQQNDEDERGRGGQDDRRGELLPVPAEQRPGRPPDLVRGTRLLVLLQDPVARAECQYRYLDKSRRRAHGGLGGLGGGRRPVLGEAGLWSATTREGERLAWKIYHPIKLQCIIGYASWYYHAPKLVATVTKPSRGSDSRTPLLICHELKNWPNLLA